MEKHLFSYLFFEVYVTNLCYDAFHVSEVTLSDPYSFFFSFLISCRSFIHRPSSPLLFHPSFRTRYFLPSSTQPLTKIEIQAVPLSSPVFCKNSSESYCYLYFSISLMLPGSMLSPCPIVTQAKRFLLLSARSLLLSVIRNSKVFPTRESSVNVLLASLPQPLGSLTLKAWVD